MKLSQAVDLYIQRKRDAGMRFDSPMRRLRSFLRHCGDIDLHHITIQQVTAFLDGFGHYAERLEWQAGNAADLFRLLDSTRSAEILAAAALCSQDYAKLRSVYLLTIRLTLPSRRRAALSTEIGLCHVGRHIPHPVAVSVRNGHAALRNASSSARGCRSDAPHRHHTGYEVL